MVEHVEGDFKHFTFKMIRPKDYPKVLAHLRKVFYREEPSCKLSQFNDEEFDMLDKYVLHNLNLGDELSVYVEEKATGKVAGVRITYRKSKSTPEPDLPSPAQQVLNLISWFGVSSKKGTSLYELYGIDFYADFLMTSVDPEFQRQGLVTEIYRRSIAMLRAKGYPLCKSIFTSPYTRRAAVNLGFEEVRRIYFVEHENDKGDKPFVNADPDQFAAVLVLKL